MPLWSHLEDGVIYNNGTHDFQPSVIFISLDGVVNHDLDLSLTPHLSHIADTGTRAHWMTPSFPPITFPNHWSLVTGLYPESHGIVGNYFYDAELDDDFNYKDPSHSWDEKWWGGEPIWITAVRQGKKAGVIMWPGCSTTFDDMQPTFMVPFSDAMTFDEKTDIALDWLDLPIESRPQFIGLYVPQIDQAGHKYGPYANQTLTQLQHADTSIGRLMQGLQDRNLTHVVNLMVVSDHGMSATDASRLVYIDDILTSEELDLIWKIEMYPTLGIRPKVIPGGDSEAEVVDRLYKAFLRLWDHYGGKEKAPFQVFKREDFPLRYHFNNNTRIAPLLVLPDPGWNLVRKIDFDPDHGTRCIIQKALTSRAIFVANGPAWDNNDGAVLKPFWNVELYQVISRVLGLKPASNNGTLDGHLPLE
ncbi:alkaline-phosphatase-like protein [Absidia repens]|uniref:Alkaline-phosphatase-like protein n=1 Tax=Absidia repens TaxID=90262 RepID=A0A1X2IJJ6_9FUNG|nr:alkaline-phosphatase-like protein [Absidia repens]